MSRRDSFDLEQQRREADLAEQRLRKQRADDIRWLMSDKRGRRIAHRLLTPAGIFQSSFEANASVTAFREGKRALGLEFLSWINDAAPTLYLEMLTEHLSDRSNDDSDR